MTTPLEKITANRRKQRELADEIRTADAELADLIRSAFAGGYTGPEIAAVAGVSKERIYQIRDGRR